MRMLNTGKTILPSRHPLVRMGASLDSRKDFSVPRKTLRNHMLITGGTQKGKSYFMELLVRKLSEDAGVVVFDPHAELTERLLHY